MKGYFTLRLALKQRRNAVLGNHLLLLVKITVSNHISISNHLTEITIGPSISQNCYRVKLPILKATTSHKRPPNQNPDWFLRQSNCY